jgi:sec-independent protein translocase protein TatC
MATQVRPSSYFGFISRVLFWVGIVFEFPLIVFILASMGLVSSKLLLQNWRIAVIVIAVIAALITPTIDPFNMLIIMGPMIVLYFLSIGLAVFAQKRRSASNPA